MDISLKQRLIGAAVIVAIAVIFIPMLFDKAERKDPVTLDMGVPPKPEYSIKNSHIASSAPNEALTVPKAPAKQVPSASEIASSPLSKPIGQRAQHRAKDQEQTTASLEAPSGAVWPTEQPRPAPTMDAGKAKEATTTAQITPPDLKGPISESSRPQSGSITPPTPVNALAARTPSKLPATKPNFSTAAMTSGWAVQVGSFSQRNNATVLLDKLRSSGFTAFQEQGSSGGERVFRVKVGPEMNRQHAEALQARLRDQENLQGIVVSQSPNS